jgi:hypothetical protein
MKMSQDVHAMRAPDSGNSCPMTSQALYANSISPMLIQSDFDMEFD